MKKIISVIFFLAFTVHVVAKPVQNENDSSELNIEKDVSLTGVYVINVYKSRGTKATRSYQRRNINAPDTLDFGDTLVVQLEHMDVLLNQDKVSLNEITLYINEFALTSLIPIRCVNDKNEICFIINERLLNSQEKSYIKKLPGLFVKEVGIGIQIKNADVFYKCSKKIFIGLTKFKDEFIISSIFSVILFIVLLVLCKKTSLIRDKSTQPLKTRTYSLSRSQLAWWTFIILTSYLFIYLVTGETDLLNLTAVTLLGISAATAAVGTTIDSSEPTEDRHQNTATEGWFVDVLSDHEGISIHRLQTLIFNMIFGLIFIRYVASNFAMPEFSENQLILLGLSSGTYSFVKTRENKNTTPQNQTDAGANTGGSTNSDTNTAEPRPDQS
ncbi:hypothetical protein JMN32_08365 [Fulvivirga sp. 29W222]|uniref:Uncharacterized protein n=1 Tax=Fulvivirga marina TaxID=2494733 RepID=A0A937FUS9_9BACT|nr:hypothetical protein [Fulvivirga marina]MBL6446319.1 hypothetical protein [Fulvivirga marina]